MIAFGSGRRTDTSESAQRRSESFGCRSFVSCSARTRAARRPARAGAECSSSQEDHRKHANLRLGWSAQARGADWDRLRSVSAAVGFRGPSECRARHACIRPPRREVGGSPPPLFAIYGSEAGRARNRAGSSEDRLSARDCGRAAHGPTRSRSDQARDSDGMQNGVRLAAPAAPTSRAEPGNPGPATVNCSTRENNTVQLFRCVWCSQ